MRTIVAFLVAGAVGILGIWLLSHLGNFLFKRRAHPVSLAVFMLALAPGLTLTWTAFQITSDPRGVVEAFRESSLARGVALVSGR